MSVDPESDETVALAKEMGRRRAHLNPDELISPTCMWWAMVAGLVLLSGVMLLWGIANLDKIAGTN